MRREDDGVTGLQADQRFEDSGRSWVSGWNDTADDTNWFRNGNGTESVVFRQHTTGFHLCKRCKCIPEAKWF